METLVYVLYSFLMLGMVVLVWRIAVVGINITITHNYKEERK